MKMVDRWTTINVFHDSKMSLSAIYYRGRGDNMFLDDQILVYIEDGGSEFDLLELECEDEAIYELLAEDLIKDATKYNGRWYVFKVNSNDNGPLPHFHIDAQDGNGAEYHGALMLDRNMDFNHNKSMRLDFTKRKFSRQIDEALRNEYKNTGNSCWKTLQSWWNKSNARLGCSHATSQPDYSIIERYRD